MNWRITNHEVCLAPQIENLVSRNSGKVEEVQVDVDNLDEYTEMLGVNESAAEFDRLEDEFVILEDRFVALDDF